MKIELEEIELIEDLRIGAVVTVQIENIGKFFGFRVIKGKREDYLCPPNFSYSKDGLKHWSNVCNFDAEVWREIQSIVMKAYRDKILKKKGDD